MFKLRAGIRKDVRLLLRDKVGLLLMFVMPIVLAILITVIQNNTFKLVNDNKVGLVVYNTDGSEISKQFVAALEKSGMFELTQASRKIKDSEIAEDLKKNYDLALVIQERFSGDIVRNAKKLSTKILSNLGLPGDTAGYKNAVIDPVLIYYSPVLQESFRQSLLGAVRACVQVTENNQLIKNLYSGMDAQKNPEDLEAEILKTQMPIREYSATHNGNRNLPNATQHNIPAWTVFAMFFIVISLGSSVVKEKLNGSFLRLKTLPSSYLLSLFSKQLTFLFVTLVQVFVIFCIGIYLFPLMGLPELNLPEHLFALFFVSLVCGCCAVSYAICIGVFANTQEQANGFGAVSIVIFAAIGGVLVPSFAMPDSFGMLMNLSPLHWCLESYYGLFLEGGELKEILANILPLVGITVLLQLISLVGLKRKNLI